MATMTDAFSSGVQPARGAERRRMPRRDSGAHLLLRVPDPLRHGAHVGPGYAHNISRGGVSVYTKHRLVPGQQVEVHIPMECDTLLDSLPPHFEGIATVLRTRAIDSQVSAIALKFDSALADDIAYAVYLDRMQRP